MLVVEVGGGSQPSATAPARQRRTQSQQLSLEWPDINCEVNLRSPSETVMRDDPAWEEKTEE